jgi:hypothetical protein
VLDAARVPEMNTAEFIAIASSVKDIDHDAR